MSRQEKTILTVFALALVLSLLALLLWQETGSDEPDGSEETAWRNFRRGADAAAVEYNVDLRYVYRYENPGQVGQLQAMEAELASGAEAVAVAPLDAEALTEYLRNHSVLQPVVAMGSEVHDEAIAGCVAVDSRAQASLLAGAIVDSGARHCRIYLRTGCGELDRQRLEGFLSSLEELLQQAVVASVTGGCQSNEIRNLTRRHSSAQLLAWADLARQGRDMLPFHVSAGHLLGWLGASLSGGRV